MMARAQSTASRCGPILPQDAPMLAEIFRASVEELTEDDYSGRSRRPGPSAADDLEEFARAARQASDADRHAWTARRSASSRSTTRDQIDLLYVHPAVAGQGVGTMLCRCAGEARGRARRARLTVDASDTAREFFEQRGFTPSSATPSASATSGSRNTTMEKKLAARRSAR